MQYSPVNFTSADVTADPSDHLSPLFSFHVIDLRSALTPPFATVGISSAKNGTSAPVSLYLANGSIIIEDDSMSLVPPDRYGFNIEGACQ